jgi:hypothetical protein
VAITGTDSAAFITSGTGFRPAEDGGGIRVFTSFRRWLTSNMSIAGADATSYVADFNFHDFI